MCLPVETVLAECVSLQGESLLRDEAVSGNLSTADTVSRESISMQSLVSGEFLPSADCVSRLCLENLSSWGHTVSRVCV
jgi:hypothetical protein